MFDKDYKGKVLIIGAHPFPNGRKFYIDDLDTYDKLLESLKEAVTMDFAFTEDGLSYLLNQYTVTELYEVFTEANVYDIQYKEEQFGDFLDVLYQNVTNKYFIMNENVILDILCGRIDELDHETILIADGTMECNYQNLKEVLTAFKNHIQEGNYNVSYFYECFLDNARFMIADFEDHDDYNYVNIYHKFKDIFEKENDLDAVEDCLELVELFKEEINKPLEERMVPDDFMMDYLKCYRTDLETMDDESVERIKNVFISFMNRLVEKNNEEGIRTKAYAYYGGNKIFKCDYKIAEEYLLKLYNEFHDFDAADALGYIYYYGRVNSGHPQFEKAYQYYNISALLGNQEAKYKVGDMYKNGYGVPKNMELAATIYGQVYHNAFHRFVREEYDCVYADVAFRMGLVAEERARVDIEKQLVDRDSYLIDMMKFYLCALYGIEKRLEQKPSSFDESTKGKIEAKLKKYYIKYQDFFLENVFCSDVLGAFYLFKIEEVNNKEGYITLSFKSNHNEVIVDVKNRTACLTKEINIKFKTDNYYIDKSILYEEAKFNGNLITFIPSDPNEDYNESKEEEEYEYNDEYYFSDNGEENYTLNVEENSILCSSPELENDHFNQYFLEFSEYEIYPQNRLIDLELEDNIFQCVKAIYYPNGKEYTFLAKENLWLAQDSKEGIVEETGQVVQITEFLELRESELPVDISFMKHVGK